MSKDKIIGYLFLVIARIFLDVGYVYYVVPYFGYSGFNLSFSFWSYASSWLIYLFVFAITPVWFSRSSDAVFMMVTTSVIAPLTSMYGLSGEDLSPVILTVLSMFYIWFVVNVKSLFPVGLPYIKDGEKYAVALSAIFVIFVVLHYFVSGAHLSLSLLKVYDFRESNAEIAGEGFFSYLNPWVCEIFNLFLLAVFLMRRWFSLVFIVLIVQVFLFAASQHKSVLFSPIIVVGVWWFFRKSRSLVAIPMAVSVLLAISFIVYWADDNITLPSLFIRRIFFTPAQLSFEYYSFFSNHPKVFWGDSWWMPFVHSPYAVTIPYVVGASLGLPDMGANNGFVSSGYAQAGYLGVFIYSSVIGLILRFVDRESIKLGAAWLGVGLFLQPIMNTWLSSDLATSMMTHGIFWMILLLAFLRKPNIPI